VVRLLLANGADPNGGAEGFGNRETPLHLAASSDDVDVAEALIDSGADVEAPGGSIAGGSPLDDAVGYGCWGMARLLVQRGARVDKLWHAAAIGMLARVQELLPRRHVGRNQQCFLAGATVDSAGQPSSCWRMGPP
jgi:ankyrin repeat protein